MIGQAKMRAIATFDKLGKKPPDDECEFVVVKLCLVIMPLSLMCVCVCLLGCVVVIWFSGFQKCPPFTVCPPPA